MHVQCVLHAFACIRGSCHVAAGATGDPELATLDAWGTVCDEFLDVFEDPTVPQDRPIKHRINLVDPKQPPHYHRQYRLLEAEQAEVWT